MRIAIYHNLPSGGGKRALYEMVRRLADAHEIDTYTLSCAEHDFCDVRPYSRQHVVYPFRPLPLVRSPFGRLNQGIRTLDLLRLRSIQQKIANRIDAAGYDVVFAHHCQYGQSPSLLSYLATPSVYYCQEPPRLVYEPVAPRPYTALTSGQGLVNHFDPFPLLRRLVLTRLDRRNVLASTLVLANSAYSRESLYRIYGIFARVCYLGVDVALFHPSAQVKRDYVVSVGSLTALKGFDFLLESLARMPAERRPPLMIVSNAVDQRERAYLDDMTARLHLAVDYRLRIPDEELVRAYGEALLTVYTPVMEPFGFTALESLACGTPVIGVCEGGLRESLVHGRTGLLVERDPESFAMAMAALLDDPATRASMGQAGLEDVQQHWQWERSVRQLEQLLASAARRRKDASRPAASSNSRSEGKLPGVVGADGGERL